MVRFCAFFFALLLGISGIASAAYVDNGDGTITDTTTGLMWQKQDDGTTRSWRFAISYCEGLPLAGYEDWRLPTIKELDSIVDLSRYNPTIDPIFSGTKGAYYWSSTTHAFLTDYAWGMSFRNGYGSDTHKSISGYARAVRAGQTRLLGHLVISAPKHGDVWQKGEVKTIAWNTQSISGNVSIALSRDGGKTFWEMLSSSTPNAGSFQWTVSGALSYNCVLKIIPLDDTSKETTQGLFSIVDTRRPRSLPFLQILLLED